MILEAPIDLQRIWECDDPSFLLWLVTVMEKVSETHRQQSKGKR